jgi:hypothetical protein
MHPGVRHGYPWIIHGYPELFSLPSGTPLELRGSQPDQSISMSFSAWLCKFRGFQVWSLDFDACAWMSINLFAAGPSRIILGGS